MTTVPGIDVSRYQGSVNWKAVADAGYRFAVVRATIWNAKIDDNFAVNWNGARQAGLLVSAYHVVKADVAAPAQIDYFAQALAGHKWDLPPVLDIERDDNLNVQAITQCVRDCLQLSEQRFGRKPLVYTGAWFWNSHVSRSTEWAQYDLWVASYGSGGAVLPAGWTAWKIWQYTGKGSAPGITGDVDLDWFNGSYDDLLKYCNASPPPPAGQAAKTKSALNVRNGPGVNYADIGDIAAGAAVTLGKIDGTDVWVQIDANKWVAFVYKGTRYAQSETAAQGLQARVLVPVLNVRSGPGVENAVVGQLQAGAVAPIKMVEGKDAWGELAPGKWIAITFHGDRLVDFV